MNISFNTHATTLASSCRQLLMVSGLMILITACGEVDVGDGTVVNSIPLPLDSDLTLYCEDAGIATERCVLDDPANPYARIGVNAEYDDDNDETTTNKIIKFDLDGDAPSAKARFYLWATAQAQSPRGENQYYTAVALHTLFTETGNLLMREQARRAYRSVLDNHFNEVTFFLIELPEGDVFFPESLKKLVGQNMYEPEILSLTPLYDSDLLILEAFGEWGYYYDTDTGIISQNF